jgi:hypothetical protein
MGALGRFHANDIDQLMNLCILGYICIRVQPLHTPYTYCYDAWVEIKYSRGCL